MDHRERIHLPPASARVSILEAENAALRVRIKELEAEVSSMRGVGSAAPGDGQNG